MPVAFGTQQVITGLSNPTSLQFGPDGRLYVSQQDGLIRIYDISQPSPGQWNAVEVDTIDLIKNIPNHDDGGTLNASINDRQVTGLLVAGTATNPVLYVTSSDPRIATYSDLNLDTNSGILSKLTWNGTSWDKVDLIRGLPRSEENHSSNGIVLSADGTKLYLAQGGNTNNGAPSLYFSNTPEYALSASVLEINLTALNAIPNKTFTYAPGITSVYKYDLPTLDDPTVANNGATGNETAGGLDVGGPFGGNDGLNQAVLPANAPLRIYATGLRNAYDLVLTQAGKLFTVDNGCNTDLGGTPIFDAAGKPTNQYNNGGTGTSDFLYLLSDGAYLGHPDPTRSNQTGAIYAYSDGSQPQILATIPNAAAAVPSGLQIASGYVIDPSKFTSLATRLAQEGQFSAGEASLAAFGASTNGLMEYTASAFNGEMTGDLVTASFDGTIKRIQVASDGVTVLGVSTLASPGGIPLDLVQGPNGSIWVAQIGAGQILALTPTAEAPAYDSDIDDDGLANTVDPFQADAANGRGTYLGSNASLGWNFQFGAGTTAPGPSGLFLGLTGHMTNGTRDFLAPVEQGGLDMTNVKIGTAAGGGLVVIEQVSSGTASGTADTGEFLFQTGVTLVPAIETFNVEWTAINPYPALAAAPTTRQIGGYIGTGTQSDFLKVVAGPTVSGTMQFQLESNGVIVASQTVNAADLLTAPTDSPLVFDLLVDRATSKATPSVTYTGSSGPVTVTGTPINLASTAILSAINGTYTVNGKPSGLAVGLWSSNTGEGSQDTFQAAFDGITISSTGDGGELVKAVNVGGGQVTASNGAVFEADPGPSTGAAASQTFATTAAISGTTDDALYQDERWTPCGSYTYQVPVANGTYQVDLLLAEIYSGITGPGQRVFDMALEGQALPALQNIDIYSLVGPNAALTISQQVTVVDGSLSIQVGPGSSATGNVENAKLNAFAVYVAGASPPPPTLSVTAARAERKEGNSGSNAFTFTVIRTGDTTGPWTATYAVTGAGGNPAGAIDFTGGVLPSGSVSFAAGETGKTITVNVAGDTTVEANERFRVTLSSPSAGTTLGTTSALGFIRNDDSTLSIAAANASKNEGNSGSTAFTFTVSRTGDTTKTSTATWAVKGAGTDPANASDFAGAVLPSGSVSFAAGETSKTITVNVAGDTTTEANERLRVTLSSPSAGTTLGTASALGTILNDDSATTLSIAAANASKNEGNSGSTAFTFTVTRSGDTTGTSTAHYAVTGRSTTPASATDFTGGVLPLGSVSFAAGQTGKTITVNVAGDTTVEANEGFKVTLSSPGAGTTLGTASAIGTILNDDSSGSGGPSARLMITPGSAVNASTYNEPSYELTNIGSTNIRSLSIDLHNSLIAGTVFDPFGTFGDTTALDFTPYGSIPVSASWSYGPTPVTEGGYKTLAVTFGGAGLAAEQTFAFRLDADPANISGPSPGPNESGSISGFEQVGATVTVGLVDGLSQSAEVFTQGTAGGGMATLSPSLLPAPNLSISTLGGVPLATDKIAGILKANLAGLNAGAGSAGNDIVVNVSGTAGQTVRLAVSELGGLGMDIPLGSHEGNTVLQNPMFIDVTIGTNGIASVPVALPAETPPANLQNGSVSGRFAITAAHVDPATGAATGLVSSTLVVKDAAAVFTSEAAADTFTFREGFATTDIFQFVAGGFDHDLIELDQAIFPGKTVQQFLTSGALDAGAGAGDVDITTPFGAAIKLHDSTGQLTVALLQSHPEDFRFF